MRSEIKSSMFSSSQNKEVPRHQDTMNPDKKVLICDNVAAHGMEFTTLILCLDENDQHTHQYIVEALMRCISKLYICIVNKEGSIDGKPAVEPIVKKWIHQKLVKKQAIELCSFHGIDDTETSSPSCFKDATYYVHLDHRKFDSCKSITWNIETTDHTTYTMSGASVWTRNIGIPGEFFTCSSF